MALNVRNVTQGRISYSLGEPADAETKNTVIGLLKRIHSSSSGSAETIDQLIDEIDDLQETKADKSTTYTKTEVDNELALKANQSTTYTKTQVDNDLELKMDKSDAYYKSQVYNKAEVDAKLDTKPNITDVYIKPELNSEFALKADKSDTYTKTQVDNALALKANSSDVYTKTQVYTKTEVDNDLGLKADKSDTYTKTQVDNLISGGTITNYVTTDTLQTITGTKMFNEIHATKSYAAELYVNTHKFSNVAAISGDSSSGNNTLCTKTYVDNQITSDSNHYPNSYFSLDSGFTAGFTTCGINYSYFNSNNYTTTILEYMDIFYYAHGDDIYISGTSEINFGSNVSSTYTQLYILNFQIKGVYYKNYNSTSSRQTGGCIMGEYWGNGSDLDHPQFYFICMTNDTNNKGLLRWIEPSRLSVANTNFVKNGYWKLHFNNYKLVRSS